MSRMHRMAAAVVGCCGLGLLAGCGYQTGGLYREGIRTVYVDMFQSKEFRRGIEMRLTEALRKQIDMKTPYRNAPRDRADTILSGEVLEFRQATLGNDFLTHRPRETGGQLIVSFRWKDRRTGKILAENPRLVQQVEYIPPVGETEFVGIAEAVEDMAERIVEQMERPW